MLKLAVAAATVFLTVAPFVQVGFGPGGATLDGNPVAGSDLQLSETEHGHVLASRDSVEPLGAPVDVHFDAGRILVLEPGTRLTRSGDTYQILSHGGKPLFFSAVDSSFIQAASPATIVPVEGGWKVNGVLVKGSQLRSALQAPPPVPPGRARTGEEEQRLDLRRVLYFDPQPEVEPTDEQTLKNIVHVSPAGF